MQVGIVAEGPSDVAVLRNILKGWLGLGQNDVFQLRPELAEDETDAAGYRARRPDQFSNWLIVLDECRETAKIRTFLDNVLDDDRIVVVQIDTAEAHHRGYDVTRPDRKAPHYVEQLRALVVAKLDGLLGPELAARVRYAVAVEETDAWVLSLYSEGKKDTGSVGDPKKQLERHPAWQKHKKGGKSPYEHYHALTIDFRARKKLHAAANRNRSLQLFVDSLPTDEALSDTTPESAP